MGQQRRRAGRLMAGVIFRKGAVPTSRVANLALSLIRRWRNALATRNASGFARMKSSPAADPEVLPKILPYGEQLLTSGSFRGPLYPLELSAPEGLEASFGCSREGTYVAFVPSVDGTGVVWDNGALDEPVLQGPWQAWAARPVVAEVLRESRVFGDRPPFRALLLDTARRRFWIADEEDVQDFLRHHLADDTGQPEFWRYKPEK